MNQPKISSNPSELAVEFTQDLAEWSSQRLGPIFIALSGGSTPKLLFELWGSGDGPEINWGQFHFFWGDERCVAPDDLESNFSVANQLFFAPTKIPESNIHRVQGEYDPDKECVRYSKLIQESIPQTNGLPVFDLVILGVGTDGHTASIFPDQIELLDSTEICGVATHPDTDQKRITLTGPVISNAKRIAFLITGESKAKKIAAILNEHPDSQHWPATRFSKLSQTAIYLDKPASSLL